MEIWKDIEGYEGLYKVSNDGKVFSIYKNRLLIPAIKKGYHWHAFRKDGKSKTFSAHRLVLNAFNPNTENKEHVNHINGIKGDNRLENLEWCTRSENFRHAVMTGLKPTKLGVALAQEIRRTYMGESFASLGRRHSVTPKCIEKILKYKTYKPL